MRSLSLSARIEREGRPSTKQTASITLLLPAPFGPITALKASLKGPMTCLPA